MRKTPAPPEQQKSALGRFFHGYGVRGEKVLIDADLAQLFGVELVQ